MPKKKIDPSQIRIISICRPKELCYPRQMVKRNYKLKKGKLNRQKLGEKPNFFEKKSQAETGLKYFYLSFQEIEHVRGSSRNEDPLKKGQILWKWSCGQNCLRENILAPDCNTLAYRKGNNRPNDSVNETVILAVIDQQGNEKLF